MKNKFAYICSLMFVLAACSSNIDTDIIGKWKGETLKQNFHFYEDGRVELEDIKYSIYKGRYTITDSNILTCTFESAIFTRPVVRTVKISGDKLILKSQKGPKEVYIRQ